jgi:hypothetical protein
MLRLIFLFYLQASSNLPNDIDPALLSLTAATKYEAGDTTHYRQFITYQKQKIQLLTQGFYSEGGLHRRGDVNNLAVLIPVNEWLRKQLNVIEQHVQENVTFVKDLPSPNNLVYRPLWGGDFTYLRMAKWCNIFQQDVVTGKFEPKPINTPLGRGYYSVTIEVPYVYIGAHKNGKDYSLSLSVVQIIYKPAVQPSSQCSIEEPPSANVQPQTAQAAASNSNEPTKPKLRRLLPKKKKKDVPQTQDSVEPTEIV